MNITIAIKKCCYMAHIIVITSCFIAACNDTNAPKQLVPLIVKQYDITTTLAGSVSTNSGLLKNGHIKASDSKGDIIATTVVQHNGYYQIEIPAKTILPIVLSYQSETNKADTEQLIAAIVDPLITKYDLNPLTTAIANKAQALGGYTRNNMIQAAESTVSVPDANKTSTGFRGDPTTQYGGWH